MLKKSKGFTLIELSVVVAVSALIAIYGLIKTKNDLRISQAEAQGTVLREIGEAVTQYTVDFTTQILGGQEIPYPACPTCSPALAAGSISDANVLSPTFNELQALGYLRAGFNPTNFFGANPGYQLTLTKLPAGCTGADCRTIQNIVALTQPITDPFTGKIDGPVIGSIIQKTDGYGGYSLAAGDLAFKLYGNVANPIAGAPGGVVAVIGDSSGGSNLEALLPRDGSRAMTAPITFANASTEGATCTAGQVSRNSAGFLLNCNTSTLKFTPTNLYWSDPVATFSALPTCNSDNSGQTRAVRTPSVTPIGNNSIRAYTCNGSGSWHPLGLNDAGVLTANGAAFSRDNTGACCGSGDGAGTISLAENTASTTRTANISFHNGGVHEGNIGLAGGGDRRIRFYDNQGVGMGMELTLIRTEGEACSTNGSFSRTSTGQLLSCASSRWVREECSYYTGDLNSLIGGAGGKGCVNGASLENAPSSDWLFVDYVRHVSTTGNPYTVQTAKGMTGPSAGKMWIRSQQNGIWASWNQTLLSGQDINVGAITATGNISTPTGNITTTTGTITAFRSNYQEFNTVTGTVNQLAFNAASFALSDGATCATSQRGLILRDSSGNNLYFCTSSLIWKKLNNS